MGAASSVDVPRLLKRSTGSRERERPMPDPVVCPFCGTDYMERKIGEDFPCIGCSAELQIIETERGVEVDVLTEPPPDWDKEEGETNV